MDYDLAATSLLLVAGMAVLAGLVAQLIVGFRRTRWMWPAVSVAAFVGGIFFSEVLFSWATVDDLQPMIDGLLLDEAMLGMLVFGVPTAIVVWLVTRSTKPRSETGDAQQVT